jgi:hypothetical protein
VTCTTQDPKKVAAALRPHVQTLLMRMAVAQVERERVDKIQREELTGQMYYGRLRDGRQVRITEPKQSWLMDDDSAARYFAKLNAVHLAAGFAAAAEGHCPALTAEYEQTKAEWALIKAAEEFFPGMTNDKLLCGTAKMGGLETRQKYLDLLCGLVINAK